MNNPLILSICKSAKQIISFQSTNAKNLLPFKVGALGDFPYYWHTKKDDTFNILTYNWINANVKAGANPIQQAVETNFTNLMVDVYKKINYSLSDADQRTLQSDQQNILAKQNVLLKDWKNIYGVNPGIDAVINTIVSTWADPPTTYSEMLNSFNLHGLLNQVPVSASQLMAPLNAYISAVNSSTSLTNAVSSGNGYLQTAIAAIIEPTDANGGLLTTDSKLYPSYKVATPLASIMNGLKNTSTSFVVKSTIYSESNTDITVTIPSYEPYRTVADTYLKMVVGSDSNFFMDLLRQSNEPVALDFNFLGVTLVNFAPASYNQSVQDYWYWMNPLSESIKNGSKDVTGYSFATALNMNFQNDGPFGFLNGVVISSYPQIIITVKTKDSKKLIETIAESSDVKVGILNNLNSEPTLPYRLTASESGEDTVTISCNYVEESDPNLESRAFVLGVQVDFPAAT